MNGPRHEFDRLTQAYAAAVLAKDPAALARLYAADARVFDAWATWSYEDRAAWRVNLDDWLGSLGEEAVEVRFDDVRSSAEGAMGYLTAIVRFAAVDKSGKELRSMQSRLSWVLAQTANGWVIAHEHTSAPIRPEDQKAMLQKD